MNKQSKMYYLNVQKMLPLTFTERTLYLTYTTKMLYDYEKEHESFTYAELVSDLGDPKEIADNYITSACPDSLRCSMENGKITFCVILSLIIALVGLSIYTVCGLSLIHI